MATQGRLDEKNNTKNNFFSKTNHHGLRFGYTSHPASRAYHTGRLVYVKTIQADASLIVTPLLAVTLTACVNGEIARPLLQLAESETRLQQEEQTPQEQTPEEQTQQEEQILEQQRAGQTPILEVTPFSLTINEGTSTAQKLADIDFANDETGTNRISIPTSAIFEIRTNTQTGGDELWLKAGVDLDFDVAQIHTIILTPISDTGEAAEAKTFTLRLNNIVTISPDIKPAIMTVTPLTVTIDEGTSTARKLADVTFIDDGQGTNAVTVPTNSIFEIRNGNELWLKAGVVFDYESATSHAITLTPDVTGLGPAPAAQTFTLNIGDIDEAPTAFTLSIISSSVTEGPSTARKLADIHFSDDALGTNSVSIPTNAIFEIRTNRDIGGNELWLKTGFVFEYLSESATNPQITLTPDVTGIGTPPAAIDFTLNIVSVTGSTSGQVIEDSRRFNTEKGQVELENAPAGASFSLSVQPGNNPSTPIAANDTEITGQYGTLAVDQDGTWVYTLDNSDTDTNTLNSGQTGTEIFTFTYTDGSLSLTHRLTLTIEGRTDHITTSNAVMNHSSSTDDLVIHDTFVTSNLVIIYTGSGNDIILPATSGAAINNRAFVRAGNGNDELHGDAGGDSLYADGGNDYINGGAGNDILKGGAGNDIFVLYLAGTSNGDLDHIMDFTRGDKIEVDTASGTETTVDSLKSAANIRWTQNSDMRSISGLFALGTNDRNIDDTIIYHTRGTASTSDDIVLMVLEDYTTDLTITDFEIV